MGTENAINKIYPASRNLQLLYIKSGTAGRYGIIDATERGVFMSIELLGPSGLAWLAGECAVCLIWVLLCMPTLIRYLHQLKFGQTERELGLASHKYKTGTPTMGGIAFICVPVVVYLICSFISPFGWNNNVGIVLFSFVAYGLIGFLDDYIIVVQKNNAGLKPWVKFAMQSVVAVVVYFWYIQGNETIILEPLTGASLDLKWFYFILIFLMFTGSTNAVNLSDGVDGLCAGLTAIALVPFAVISWMQGRFDLMAVCLMVICSLLGYLKYNLHPARVFMGDTGSLALGGLLAALAMVLKIELVFVVIGGVFVAEALSVMLQVFHFKRTGKRIFLMAPLHHHFEKKGWSETRVVHVFWAWGALFALLGLLWYVL